MQNLKISIITVAYNAESTIERCIRSVARQKFGNIQHIIIDGGSTDRTLEIIGKYRDNISVLVSEADKGIYDAMNKGIKLAEGEIIGTLNADDFLADQDTLTEVSEAFSRPDVQILYGDLDYINPDEKVIRKWRSGKYKSGMFNWGWMPPHPTLYCKRALFDSLGHYRLDYGSAADYELMLRFMHTNKAHVVYHNKIMVKMQTGGVSNKSARNRLKALLFDLKAMRNNGILFPYITIIFKPLRKIGQFFR